MKKLIKTLLILVLILSPFGEVALAAPAIGVELGDQTNVGVVSLTFDDALRTTYKLALPVMTARNLTGTVYVPTNFVGKPGFMTWSQLQEIQNQYGWEIGSHSLSHSDLSELTTTQLQTEVTQSETILESKGLNVTTFATPYGSYNNQVVAELSERYQAHRGFWDRDDLNTLPYNNAVLMVQSVQKQTTVDQVKAWVDQAKNENKWLILVFHEVDHKYYPNYDYVTTVKDFEAITDYIVSSGIQVKTVDQATETTGENRVQNGSFEQGLIYWTSDTPNKVKLNAVNAGSFPSPLYSITMKSETAKNVHLFSEKMTITPSQQYAVRTFFNTSFLTVGEVGVYIDEYDMNGNWISGQWLGKAKNNSVEVFGRLYQPTSENVSTMSVQVYLTPGSDKGVIVDNVMLLTN